MLIVHSALLATISKFKIKEGGEFYSLPLSPKSKVFYHRNYSLLKEQAQFNMTKKLKSSNYLFLFLLFFFLNLNAFAQRKTYLYDNIYSIGGNVYYQKEFNDFFSNLYLSKINSTKEGIYLFLEGPIYTNLIGVFKIGLNFSRSINKSNTNISDKYLINGFDVWSMVFRKTRFPLFIYYIRNKEDYNSTLYQDQNKISQIFIFRGKFILSRKDEFSFFLTKYQNSIINYPFTPKDNSLGILWNHKFKKVEIIKGGRLNIVEKGKSQIWFGYNFYDRNLSYIGAYYSLLPDLSRILTPASEKRHHFFFNSYNEINSIQLFSQFNYLTNGNDNIYFARVSSAFSIFSNTKSDLAFSYSLSDFLNSQNNFFDTEWRTYTSRKGIFNYITSYFYMTFRNNQVNNEENKTKALYYFLNSELDLTRKLKGRSYVYTSLYQAEITQFQASNFYSYGAGINLSYSITNKTDLFFEYNANVGAFFIGEKSLINSIGAGVTHLFSNKLNLSFSYSKQFSYDNPIYNGYQARLLLQGILMRNLSYLSMNSYTKSRTYLLMLNLVPTYINSYNQINYRLNRRLMIFTGFNYSEYKDDITPVKSLYFSNGIYARINRFYWSLSSFLGKYLPEQGSNWGIDYSLNFGYANFLMVIGYRYVKNNQLGLNEYGNRGIYFRVNRGFNLAWW